MLDRAIRVDSRRQPVSQILLLGIGYGEWSPYISDRPLHFDRCPHILLERPPSCLPHFARRRMLMPGWCRYCRYTLCPRRGWSFAPTQSGRLRQIQPVEHELKSVEPNQQVEHE